MFLLTAQINIEMIQTKYRVSLQNSDFLLAEQIKSIFEWNCAFSETSMLFFLQVYSFYKTYWSLKKNQNGDHFQKWQPLLFFVGLLNENEIIYIPTTLHMHQVTACSLYKLLKEAYF